MRPDRLDADGTHVCVVRVPSPESVGDPDHVLELARPSALEELVEGDPVRAVGLLGQHVPSHRVRELPRGGPIAGTDDVVGREGAIEREERAGPARHGVVVVAEPVCDCPRAQDRERDSGARGGGSEPCAPGHAKEEGQHRDEHEDLECRAGKRGRRSRCADDRESSGGRRDPRARDCEPPCGERGSGDGLTRRRVEEDPVARVHEQRDRGQEGRAWAERESGPRPRDHRGGEEQRHHHFETPAAEEVESPSDHEGRQRCPIELRHRDDRVPVPHLDVVADVGPEVAPRDDRQRDAPDAEHTERESEDGRPAPERSHPGLRPGDRVAQATRHLDVGARPGGTRASASPTAPRPRGRSTYRRGLTGSGLRRTTRLDPHGLPGYASASFAPARQRLRSLSEMPDLRLVPKPELDRLRSADVDQDARLALLADVCRLNALVAVKRAGSGHLGSTFSALDIVAHLLFDELDVCRARLRRSRPRRLLLVEGPRRPRVVRGTLRAGCRVAGPAAPPAPPRRPRWASGRRRARDRGELRLARDGHLEGAWNRARQAPARPRRSGRRHDRRRGVAGGPELGGAAVGRARSPGQALGRRRSQRGAIGQADGGDRRAGRPRGEAPGVRMGCRDGRRARPRRVEVGLRELP